MTVNNNLIIRVTRQSAGTNNDGVSQATKLTSAFVHHRDAWSDSETKYCLHPKIYSSQDVSRYEPYQSEAVHELLHDLRYNIDPTWNATILFKDSMRIAEDPDDLEFFLRTVECFRPGTVVRTLAEYGMPLVEVAKTKQSLAGNNRAISAVASARNAGKSVPIIRDIVLRGQVTTRAQHFKDELLSNKDNPVKAIVLAAKERGEAILDDPQFDERWRAAQRNIVKASSTQGQRDKAIRQEAQALITEESISLDAVTMALLIIIYIRYSPGIISIDMFAGIPIGQLSWDLAMAEARYGTRFGEQLVIIYESKQRTNRCNPRFGAAAKQLVCGKVKGLITKAPNRVTCHPESPELLFQIGKERKARVDFSMHVGQDPAEVVRSESSRKTTRKSGTAECKDELAGLRNKLDPKIRPFSDKMLDLSDRRLTSDERSACAEKLGLSAAFDLSEEDSDDDDGSD